MTKKLAQLLTVEVGQQFGNWTVLEADVRLPRCPSQIAKGQEGFRAAKVQCLCPEKPVRLVRIDILIHGKSLSCGCIQAQLASLQFRRHGLSHHPLYAIHKGMMRRCYIPGSHNYDSYGARGIRVFPEWHDVQKFIDWVDENLGARPPGCSLDRINNDGHYAPGNVRWADAKQQKSNQRVRWTLTEDEVWLVEMSRAGYSISVKII